MQICAKIIPPVQVFLVYLSFQSTVSPGKRHLVSEYQNFPEALPYWGVGEADPTGCANGSLQNATHNKILHTPDCLGEGTWGGEVVLELDLIKWYCINDSHTGIGCVYVGGGVTFFIALSGYQRYLHLLLQGAMSSQIYVHYTMIHQASLSDVKLTKSASPAISYLFIRCNTLSKYFCLLYLRLLLFPFTEPISVFLSKPSVLIPCSKEQELPSRYWSVRFSLGVSHFQ